MNRFLKILIMVVAMMGVTALIALGNDGEAISNYGLLSLVPPIFTIALAFLTKETLVSMFMGVWLGSTIMAGWNPLDGLLNSITNVIIFQMSDSWNAGMLVLISLIGGFMFMISACGGAEAFGRWAQSKAKTPKSGQLMAWLAPFFLLFDQGCLLVGIIMRPVTERLNISRVKLAYITDSMGAPLVSMSPINDNGVYLVSLIAAELAALGIEDNAYSVYFGMFQFNLYAVATIFTVLAVIVFDLNIGPMYKAEKLARETGKTYNESDNLMAEPPVNKIPEDVKLSLTNFLIPVVSLMAVVLGMIFYTGNAIENGIFGSFSNCDIQLSLIVGFLTASIICGIIGVYSKFINAKEAINQWVDGAAVMLPVLLVLIMAWSISGVTKEMQIGEYVTSLVQDNIPITIIPMIMFALGVIISFATGSSWGVWAIGLPIAMPIAATMGISIPLVVGAVVSGGLFGDNCSPISDTTIQSSTSACCDHLQHVKTQLPYASIVGICSMIGYLVAGVISDVLALPVTIILVLIVLFILKKKNSHF